MESLKQNKQSKTLFHAQSPLTEGMYKTTEHKQNSSNSDLFWKWFFFCLLIFLRNIHLERKNAFSSITKEASLWNPIFVLHNVDLYNLQRILSEVHKQRTPCCIQVICLRELSSLPLSWFEVFQHAAKLRSNHCNNWLRIPTEILRKETSITQYYTDRPQRHFGNCLKIICLHFLFTNTKRNQVFSEWYVSLSEPICL